MKTKSILDLIGLFGGILVILSFIDRPFFANNKITFLIAGVITIGIYIKIYLEEEAVSKIKSLEKKLNRIEYSVSNKLDKQNQNISKIRGLVEAINFFNKRGVLDPVTLIIIIIIIIIIILALQGKI